MNELRYEERGKRKTKSATQFRSVSHLSKLLQPNLIRFAKVRHPTGIEVFRLFKLEIVTVKFWRVRHNLRKALVGGSVWESNPGEQIRFPWIYAAKPHSDLKNNSRFLRRNDDWSAPFNHRPKFFKRSSELWVFSFEMMIERIPRARMPNILGDKLIPALRASPQRSLFTFHRVQW